MIYEGGELLRLFDVTRVYAIRRYELEPGRAYEADARGRLELICVERGAVHAVSDERSFYIRQREAMLHMPAQVYAVTAAGQETPLVTVMVFECASDEIARLSEGVLACGARERRLLARIVDEAERAFSYETDEGRHVLRRKPDAPPGAEQLVRIGIETLLVLFLRNAFGDAGDAPLPAQASSDGDGAVFRRVTRFMEENLDKPLRLSDFCACALRPRLALQRIFNERVGTSVIDYFIVLRMDAAKRMLRARNHNITEIAEALGYASIHYFSRSFKRETGMTPSEYANRAQNP